MHLSTKAVRSVDDDENGLSIAAPTSIRTEFTSQVLRIADRPTSNICQLVQNGRRFVFRVLLSLSRDRKTIVTDTNAVDAVRFYRIGEMEQ